ncbi:MAG: C39 family peptidase [Actinomycetota bacterium]
MTRLAYLTVAVAAGFLFGSAGPALASQPYHVNFKNVDFSSGTTSGLVNTQGTLTLASGGLPTFDYTDPYASVPVLGQAVDGTGTYSYGTWTSPVYPISFPFTELVSSWNSDTTPGTWVQSEVKPRLDNGRWAKWYILGRWAYNDSDFHRTSVGHQGDGDGFVAIDTFFTKDHPAVAYQLRLTIFRRVGSSAPVSVSRYSAVASNLRNQRSTFPSATTMNGETIDLGDFGLQPFSQEIHHGEYPEFDNGGEAWCSPTSTAMVVRYWQNRTGTLYAPSAAELAWVQYPVDPEVDYTARFVYDYHYQGAGNWPFNTAYAAERGLVSDVTQLHNLSEAEPFIRAGIPLVASVAWESNKLDTAIKSTNGHLMVIGGFTGNGNVIAYDPASPTDAEVRHVYDREQFERAWIPASGGIVYVDRPAGWYTPSLTAHND